MVFHFLEVPAREYLPRPIAELIAFGWSGVDLFFVLSGFLITSNLLAAKGRPHYYRNFYARRTLRIFPLYYAVLAFVFLVVARFPSFEPERVRYVTEHQAWFWLYSSNFLIAKNGAFVLAAINQFWSLSVEEHFYLLWPAVVGLTTNRTLRWISGACMVGAILLRALLITYWPSNPAAYVITPCRIDGLAFGALLASLVRENGLPSVTRKSRFLALGAIFVMASLGLWQLSLKPGSPLMLVLGLSVNVLGYGGLHISSVAAPAGSLLGVIVQSRVLAFFGKYAYGLYIFHFPIQIIFQRLVPFETLHAHLGFPLLAIVAHTIIVGSVSVSVALLSFHLFEKHFLKLKRYFTPSLAEA